MRDADFDKVGLAEILSANIQAGPMQLSWACEGELRAYRGKRIVEVKPMWANKGSFVKEVLSLYSEATFILGMGDDRTDEDLFSRLPDDAWSIHVGNEPSKARFSIAGTVQVRNFLNLLSVASRGVLQAMTTPKPCPL